MEKICIHYWNIGFTLGLTLVTFATLILLYILTDKDKADSGTAMVSSFYKSFDEANIGLIILKQFIIILLNFFLTTLTILTSFYFEPSFVLISYVFSKFYQALKDNLDKAYCIVFFVLQFFCLMILLEIIELNFCDLNKNSRRNIEKRGIDDLLGDNGRDSSVGLNIMDINKDYYLNKDNEEPKNEQIELYEQISKENDENTFN